MDFGVLGPLTVWRAGVPLELGTPKGRVLLAVLLSRPGRPVTDDALVEAVWGEEQPKSAAKNAQTYVHRLRRRLGDPGRIAREGRGYLLRAGRDELDAARFEDLAGAARSALAAGEREQLRRLFDEALGLWRGPAFSGIADVPALSPEATRLDELRLGVVEERVDVDLRLGRHSEVLGELTALTGAGPRASDTLPTWAFEVICRSIGRSHRSRGRAGDPVTGSAWPRPGGHERNVTGSAWPRRGGGRCRWRAGSRRRAGSSLVPARRRCGPSGTRRAR